MYQLNLQLADKTEELPYYAPVLKFPESISEADQARLKAAYRATVTDDIYPAYTRLRDFLKNEYLPKAREGVGLVHMKGGEKLYDYLIEDTTTLPLKAAEVHQIGLDEVIRIQKEMGVSKEEVGFEDTLADCFNHLPMNTKIKYENP